MLELMNDSRSLLVMLYAIRLLQLVAAVRLAMWGADPSLSMGKDVLHVSITHCASPLSGEIASQSLYSPQPSSGS